MLRHNSFHQGMIFLTVLLLQFAFLHAEVALQLVGAPNFTLDEFMEPITLVTEDDWYTGQNANYEDGAIWLNPDPRQVQTRFASNIGKIIYKDKVQFIYAGYGMISFDTSFTFQFITTNPYPNCGSGMVFFVADYYKAPERSYGRYFGLVSPNRTNSFRFFAVEFDTHLTVEFADPSASHVGIDINSLISLQSVDSKPNSSSPFFPELYLYNNSTFTAWIEYDAQKTLIQVWMSSSNLMLKPPSPCLSLRYNLSDVFQDYMYVGFSASSNASEDSMEGLALSAWNLTVYPPDRDRREDKLLIHLRLLVGLFGLVLFCVCSACLCQISQVVKKKKARVSDEAKILQMRKASRAFVENLICHATLKEYSFEELLVASKNFCESNEVGEGNYGVVYKATLADGKMVAIKRLKGGCRKELEFSAEIGVISNIRHKNLLPLRGWCYDKTKEEALLVYDYMRRGSLSGYLYGKDRGALSSQARLDILAGVAAALEYLHENLGDRVLHRDVKAANVLLTEDWTPVLGDFGLARLIRHTEHSVVMTVAGSPGYIAPEVVFSNKVTDKADVYSFGVLLLVVACGRPALHEPASRASEPSGSLLVDWIWNLHENNRIMEALDPPMIKGMTEEETREWRRALYTALACIQHSPKLRPSMRQVFQALQGEDFDWMQAPPARTSGYYEEASYMSVSQASSLQVKGNVREFPVDVDGRGTCVGPLPSASYAQMSCTFGEGENCEGR